MPRKRFTKMKHFHVPGVHDDLKPVKLTQREYNPVPNSPENFDTQYVILVNLIGLQVPRIY